jgi:hypothetical protein
MSDSGKSVTRRQALSGLVVLPAIAGFLASATTIAEAKISPASVKYQTHPKGKEKCSGCRFFQAGKSASAMGTCTIVAGAISPNGWCMDFAAK